MKQNNRGMTLVEIVVAFAILGFLSTAIFSMIVTGTKTYTRLTSAINLQYDTQLASAKIEKQLLNCNDGIYWNNNQIIMVEDNTVHVYSLNTASNTLYYGSGVLGQNGQVYLTVYRLAENVTVMKITDYEHEDEGGYRYIKCLHLQMELEHNDKVAVVDKTISLRSKPRWRHFSLNITYNND